MTKQTQDAQALILLVDDDPDFLEINRQILQPAGYEIRCADNPAAAWAALCEEKPDLVITDLMMSSLDSGFSFARRIKEDERLVDLPVIIVTAVSSQAGFDFRPRTDADLKAMYADAFFDKPVPAQALLQRVAELLSARAQARH